MTDPKDLPHEIGHREMIAETAGPRVQILTLGRGERVPLHDHSEVSDTGICLGGRSRRALAPET